MASRVKSDLATLASNLPARSRVPAIHTGLGHEKMMGKPKTVNYREVTLALCYFGMIYDDPAALALAEKVHAWSNRAKP